MTDPQPILDYASPRPRSKLRLPARSQLDVDLRSAGTLVVTERLVAKRGAIGAIAFALVTMVLLVGVTTTSRLPRGRDLAMGLAGARHEALVLLAIFAVLAIGIVVMLRVIHETWRRTELRADGVDLVVRFASPFGGKQHAWPARAVESVQAVAGAPPHVDHLAELRIHVAGGQLVHLFTDHPRVGIENLATEVGRALAGADARVTSPAAAQPLSGVAGQ